MKQTDKFTDGIKNKIRDIIESTYKCCFLGEIDGEIFIVNGEPRKFTCFITPENEHSPNTIHLIKLCKSEEDFLKYIYKELEDKQLIVSKHAEVKLLPYKYED